MGEDKIMHCRTCWGRYPQGARHDCKGKMVMPKPEPEPDWRSMYEDEKEAHAETKRILMLYTDAFGPVLARQEGYKIG